MNPDRHGSPAVYLTAEAWAAYHADVDDLRDVDRPRIAERVRLARESSDASSSTDAAAAEADLGFLDGRIHELERLLARATVIAEPPSSATYVQVGSRVTVEDDERQTSTYDLVSPREAEPRQGLISNESPIGRALLGKRVGDQLTVVAPGGSFHLRVVAIA